MRVPRSFLLVVLCLPLLSFAQHVELGVFADYTRQPLPNSPDNLFGVGGRLNVNLARVLQFELESAYDFKYPHFQTTVQPNAIILNSSELGIIHANAGLKIQSPGGSIFGFIKGGVNDYRSTSSIQTATGPPFGVTVVNLPDSSFAKGVLYPGGGLGFHAGPLGIRLDAGDEIIWLNGSVHNSLRVTFGPTLRF